MTAKSSPLAGQKHGEAMNVYRIGGADLVVAEDVKDAWKAWKETNGEDHREYIDSYGIEHVSPTTKIAIMVNDKGEIDDGGGTLELSAEAWAKREGRGFLASSEY